MPWLRWLPNWGLMRLATCLGTICADSTGLLIRQKRISINPLELIAVATTIVFLGNVGLIPAEHPVALRCYNTTACRAANVGVIYSTAMRFTLRIFVRSCQAQNVRC